MVHLFDVDLKDTQFYRDVFAEGADFGRREGRREGERQGRQAGEAEVLLRLLRKRFGVQFAATQEAAIRALQEEHLNDLAEALLDFRSSKDFADWLARNP